MSELSSCPAHARRSSARAWMTLLVSSLALGACQPVVLEQESPSRLFLDLRSLTGDPVLGARIYLPSGERLQSGPRGLFLWDQLLAGHQPLRVEAPGFAPSLVSLDVGQGVRAGTQLKLLPLGAPVATFNTREGATFSKADIVVSVPPGKLFDAEGRVLEGEVDAYLAPLDLNDLEKADLLAVPGELRGVLHPGEPPVNLESVALMVLTFQQRAGADLRSGAERSSRVSSLARRLKIRGSVPRSVLAHAVPPSRGGAAGLAPGALEDTAPSEVPLWRLDPDTGLWLPTGDVATLEESPAGSDQFTYELTLDQPAPLIHVARPFADHPRSPASPQTGSAPMWRQTVCLAVRVEDEKGQPVVGRTVVALGLDYASVSRAVTDGKGRALLEVMRDREVLLNAGTDPLPLHTSSEAGTCAGQGAAPTDITLRVPAPMCLPGTKRACRYSGPEGTLGVGICQAARRVCDVNGAGWSTSCEGEVLPQEERCDNALDDNCDGVTNEGCPVICVPGDKRSCYEGPEGTQDVGLCRAGTRTCVFGGTAWSGCAGQVLPRTEDCARPEDENCDGTACQCWPGEHESCAYTGPAGTEGVGLCHGGARTCEPSDTGTAWSACASEVAPQAESCFNAVDDDCDGLLDNSPRCSWSQTRESMSNRRVEHTATLLGNGRVLVTGGQEYGSSTWGTSTLYDPSNDSWSTPATMAQARSEHTATLLNNGKVLVAGGNIDIFKSLKDAEVYDPATDSWSSANPMNESREEHAAARLLDGRVLVMGGSSYFVGYFNSAEVYNPTSNTWLTTSAMNVARVEFAAITLPDGRVLVTGGRTNTEIFTATEVYDPNNNTWTNVGDMAEARFMYAAVLLKNGGVLVVGGMDASYSILASAEVYDPVTQTWSSAGKMASPRTLAAAVVLSDGRVLVTGGVIYGSTSINTAEVYDPTTHTWSLASHMISPRDRHTATLLNDGRVLVVGGEEDLTKVYASAEYVQPTLPASSP